MTPSTVKPLLTALFFCAPMYGYAAETVSIGSKAGDQASYASTAWASVSADGRYTSLTAMAGFMQHVFLYDRYTKTSKDLTAAGNSISFVSDISANGRVVAFRSSASNLVASDSNGAVADIFVQDVITGKNELISKAFDGTGANGQSLFPALSGDGQFVAFSSSASNLVGKDTNNAVDAFLRDRKTGKTVRVSVSSTGAETTTGIGNGIVDVSADGRYVVFTSFADNLVSGDTGNEDVFLRDVKAGTTVRVSQPVRTDGFDGGSRSPSISGDGRYIAFASNSSKLTSTDTDDVNSDIFVYDRNSKTSVKITKNADNSSILPSISADGRFVGFISKASNLVAGDTNGVWDSFAYDRNTGKTVRINLTAGNKQSAGDGNPIQAKLSLSADGRFAAFESAAKDLTADDTDSAATDVFLRDTLLNKSKTANMALTVTAPASVVKGQQYTYTFTATNLGSATASQANVMITVPANVTINSVTPAQGGCIKGPVTVCRLGSIGSGVGKTVQLKVTAPSAAGGVSISGTVQSVELDTVYGNNAVVKNVTVN